jgi:hypothetical protein
MTLEQFIADLNDLVDVVRKRFGQDKVVIYGHSRGLSARRLLCRTIPREGCGICR